MKKHFLLSLLVFCSFMNFFLIGFTAFGQSYSGGAGIIGNPFQIANKADLKYLSENSGEWSKHFIQTANIIFNTTDFQSGGDFFNGGAGFIPIGLNGTPQFTGSYNGQKYKISGLFINRPTESYIGLFGYVYNATISNIFLENVSFVGQNTVGGLLGYATSSTISNCGVSGSVALANNVSNSNVGGLIGRLDGTNVSNSFSKATVVGRTLYAGGLIGQVSGLFTNFTISDCYATGSVSCTGGDQFTGGLIGQVSGGDGSMSFATVTIQNCYSVGQVTGTANVGGFVGAKSGFVTDTNCFWDNQTSTQGLSAVGTGKTTAEMKTLGTFTGANWDFVGESVNGTNDYWGIYTGINNGYPILSWEFHITTLNPTRNALNIANNATITTNFTATPNAPNFSKIKVMGSQTGFYTAGTITGTNPITIPTQNFKAGETVTVAFLTTLQGTGGEQFTSTHQYQFTAAAVAAPASFVITNYDASAVPSAVCSFDYDNDGDLDLAVTSFVSAMGGYTLGIKINNGSGVYNPLSYYSMTATAQPKAIVALDADANGYMDLAVVNRYDQTVSIFLNSGASLSKTNYSLTALSYANDIIAFDADGDGDTDLATSNDNLNSVSILTNSGSGVFSVSNFSVGTWPMSLAAFDADADGDMDLAVGHTSGGVHIYKNDGTGVFTFSSNPTTGASYYSVHAFNADNDNDIDLAVTIGNSNGLRILSNDGTGTFTLSGSLMVGSAPRTIASLDADGDADLDLAIANEDGNTISVAKNDGSGAFTLFSTLNTGTKPIDLIAADLDLDGDMDLAGTNYNSSSYFVFKNYIDPFTVINTNDSGIGSLRQAIINANNTAGANTILFQIPTTDPNYTAGTNKWLINLTSDLPTISEELVIDASNQAGFTNASIILDGTAYNSTACIDIQAFNTKIYGFTFRNFKNTGGDAKAISVNIASNFAIGDINKGNIFRNNNIPIQIQNASGGSIKANKFATSDDGLSFVVGEKNAYGIVALSSPNLLIGGTNANEGNLISGSYSYGILLESSPYSQILNNKIGLSNDENTVIGNSTGVHITNSNKVSISYNVIGGNTTGINIQSISDSCTISYNWIGLNRSSAAKSNDTGIFVNNLNATFISANVISGNTQDGILAQQNQNLQISYNRIGLQYANDIPLANQRGINISTNNTNSFIKNNIVSGNTKDGIGIDGSSYITLQNNRIGTNATGTASIPNGQSGIFINNSSNIYIGGTRTQGNQIAGKSYGISANSMTSSRIAGNNFGISSDLSTPFAPTNENIYLTNASISNQIGGFSSDSSNIIAYSPTNGIKIEEASSVPNYVLLNQFFCNQNGISVASGANNNIQIPAITNAASSTGGFVEGKAFLSTGVVYLYKTYAACNPQGYQYVGSSLVTGGIWKVNSNNLVFGDQVVAIFANSSYGTSEFSSVYAIPIPPCSKPVISKISISQTSTCKNIVGTGAVMELSTTIPFAISYDIDLNGDGIYEKTAIPIVSNKLTVSDLFVNQAIVNTVVKAAQMSSYPSSFITCPSDAFAINTFVSAAYKTSPFISAVYLTDASACGKADGKIEIFINDTAQIAYNIDINNDNIFDYLNIVSKDKKIIIDKIAGNTHIKNIRIQVTNSDCEATFQTEDLIQNPPLPFTSVTFSVDKTSYIIGEQAKISLPTSEKNVGYFVQDAATNKALSDTVFSKNAEAITLTSTKLISSKVGKLVAFTSANCSAIFPKVLEFKVDGVIFPDELSILEKFYKSTGGGNTWRFVWLFDNKAEHLAGVTIVDGHVVSIDVNAFGLIDKIPTEILNLPKLTTLNVSSNSLTFQSLEPIFSKIPIFNFANQSPVDQIETRYVVQNGTIKLETSLTGTRLNYEWQKDGKKIEGNNSPILELKNVTKDQEGIYICKISSEAIPNFAIERNQITLKVIRNQDAPSYAALKEFADALNGKNWTNQWTDDIPITEWYGLDFEGDALKSISLTNNKLQGQITPTLINKLKDAFSSLEILNLSNNNISGDFPVSLTQILTLKVLDLSNNQITGIVPNSLNNLKDLHTLWLNDNKITDFEEYALNLPKLRSLFVNENLLQKIPSSVYSLSELLVLDLSNNQIGSLENDLQNLRKLKYLSLGFNQISTLPDIFEGLKQLEFVYFHNNRLKDLPASLQNLPNLYVFSFHANFLDFGTIENFVRKGGRTETEFIYSPQNRFGKEQELVFLRNSPAQIAIPIGGKNNAYFWYKDNKLVSNSPTYQINPINESHAGIYVLEVINSQVPDLKLVSFPISVKITCQSSENAFISALDTKFCLNTNFKTQLKLSTSQDLKIEWFKGDAKIAFETANQLVVNDIGKYKALLSDPLGCSYLTNEIEISLFPKKDLALTQNSNLFEVQNAQDFVFFQWYFEEKAIEKATQSSHEAKNLGNYFVQAIDKNGCSVLSKIYKIDITAIENAFWQDLRIYPNPSQDFVNIEGKTNFVVQKIRLFDAKGSLLWEKDHNKIFLKEKIDLQNRPSQLYHLQFFTENGIFTRKIIKQY